MTSIRSCFIIPPKSRGIEGPSRLFLVFPSWRSWSLVTIGDCLLSVCYGNLQGTASIIANPLTVIWVIWRCWGIWYILPFGWFLWCIKQLSPTSSQCPSSHLFMQKIVDFSNSTEITSFVSSTVSSISGYSLSWYTDSKHYSHLFMQKKIVDFSNSTEITSFVSSTVSSISGYSLSWYIDSKHYSRFSGEVVELVVSASVFNPALLPDDETLLRAYGNSKLSTLANFYGEKAEVTLEGVTSCY